MASSHIQKFEEGIAPSRPPYQSVAIDGYELADGPAGAFIRPRNQAGPVREVDPSADPVLFANFQRIWWPQGAVPAIAQLRRDKLLEFVNEWGLLSGGSSDSLETWAYEAGWMHVLFSVWNEGLRRSDEAAIDRLAIPYFFQDEPDKAPEHVEPRHAALYVAAFTNKHLRGATEKADEVRVESDDTRFTVTRSGGTLLRTVWMQFAEALVRDVPLQSCPFCGKWREVIKGSRYCSNSCRQKSARFRKSVALSFRDEGKTAEWISELMQVPLATVERWIAAHDSKKKAGTSS